MKLLKGVVEKVEESKVQFPKMNSSREKGNRGQTCFQCFVQNELKCIYHKVEQENDYGIDGYIELVDKELVTGKRIGVQIKHGNSYFRIKTEVGYKYVGENKHLNYYMNMEEPVFIVIMDEEFSRMKWVQFKIEKTMPVKDEKWWIEVRDENNIKENFKEAIFEVAGPIIDYEEQIQKDWMISELFQSTNATIFAITKAEIENEDFSDILNYISVVSRNSRMLTESRTTLEIFFPEYADDTREIFQIPEVVSWIDKSLAIGIPWFYFLDYRKKNIGLMLLLESFCATNKIRKNENYSLLVEIDMGMYARFMEINFYNLNRFTEENGISEDINAEISDGIISYYESRLKMNV